MLLTSDGFDHYGPTTTPAASITEYLQAAGYVVNNATATTFKIINGTDAGSLGLQLTVVAASTTPPSMSRSFSSAAQLVVCGFGFRGTVGRLRFCRIAGVVDLDWDTTTGKMKIGTDLGQDTIILNAWWYIEIAIDKAANEIRVYANDTLQLTVGLPPGVGNDYTITWGIPSTSPTGAVMDIDDFYVVDSSGGQNNTRLGPVAIITRKPTSDVVAQWTVVGQPTTTPHYQIAGQDEPGKANAPYLQANVAGRTDRYTSNTVMPNDNTIFAVSLVAFARKGDLDDRKLGMTIATTAGTLEIEKTLTEGYRFQQVIFEQAPGGTPWDRNKVESSEFGMIAR